MSQFHEKSGLGDETFESFHKTKFKTEKARQDVKRQRRAARERKRIGC